LRRLYPQGLVLILIAAAYGQSLFGGFTSDDWAMIVGNHEKMGTIAAVPKFFTNSVWAFSNVETSGGSLYRPVWLLWHFLNYSINGEQPLGWHLSSVALHTLNVFLVASLIRRLLPETTAREQYLAAALFAVHPALAQSVAGPTGATDLLLTAAFLAGFSSHLRFRETGRARHVALTGFWYGVAVLSKEAGFVFPFVVIAYDLCLWKVRKDLPYRVYAVLFGIAGIYLVARTLALQAVLQSGSNQFEITVGSVLRLAEYALVYARLLVVPWPIPLYMRHLPDGIAEVHELGLGAVIVAGLLGALFHPRTRFPVLWTGLTLAIPLLLALHGKGQFAARFLYLPMAGGAVVAAAVLSGWSGKRSLAATWATIGVAVSLALLTHNETLTWQNQETWARKVIAFDPKSRIGWLSLASYYLRDKDDAKAIRTYREGMERAVPVAEKAAIAEVLGLHYADTGRFAASLELYQWISEQDGFQANGLLGVGNNYFVMGRYAEAVEAYHRARRFAPTNLLILFNLGLSNERLGREQDAAVYYRQLLRLAPNWTNRQALAQARRFLSETGR
jgi:tetratricopeptide (TPR) repeat protein